MIGAVTQRCSMEKFFLEILQNSQVTLCQSHFFNKVAGPRPATLIKKRLWHRCFPVNFAKYLRTRFLKKHFWVTTSEYLMHFNVMSQIFKIREYTIKEKNNFLKHPTYYIQMKSIIYDLKLF